MPSQCSSWIVGLDTSQSTSSICIESTMNFGSLLFDIKKSFLINIDQILIQKTRGKNAWKFLLSVNMTIKIRCLSSPDALVCLEKSYSILAHFVKCHTVLSVILFFYILYWAGRRNLPIYHFDAICEANLGYFTLCLH